MNFVLDLQQTEEHRDDSRACNFVSLASCSICSVSTVSVGLCLG